MSDVQQRVQFYETVIGDGCFCLVGLNSTGRPSVQFPGSLTALLNTVEAWRKLHRDVYFTVGGTKDTTNRKAPNIKSLRAVFADIDCGPGKPYADQRAAAKALVALVASGAIPKPSWLVNTGGGIHAYWCADEAVAPDDWQVVANGLRETAKAAGLMIDGGITIDRARIMRTPGTENWKTGQPRPTGILSPAVGTAPIIYTWDELRSAFPSNSVSIRTSAAAPALALNGKLPSAFGNSFGDDWDGWANPERTRQGYRMENLQHHCPLIRDIVSKRGAGVEEPVWFRTLALAAYCEDGESYAMGPLSDGYEGFDPIETLAKFKRTQAEASKPGANFGPPTCKTFNTVSPVCGTCPHYTEWSTTPGFPWRAAAMPTLPKDADGQIVLPDDWLPPDFPRRDSGVVVALVQQEVEDDDGVPAIVTKEVEFSSDTLHDFRLVVKEVTPRDAPPIFVPHIQMRSRDNPNNLLYVDTSKLSTGFGATLESTFRSAGFKTEVGGFEHFRNLSMQLFKAMELNRRSAGIPYPVYDSENLIGFSRGYTEFRLSGRTLRKGQAIPSVAAIPLVSAKNANPVPHMLMPYGSERASRRAVLRFLEKAHPLMALLLAASLASPLLSIIGMNGFLILLTSQRTGSGKTTALKAAASLWGMAQRMILGSASSTLGHQKHASMVSPLATFIDEMRFASFSRRSKPAPGAFDHMALKMLTECSSGGKMTSTGALRETLTWRSLTIAASNDSVSMALDDEDASTLPTTARTMEICLDDYPMPPLPLDTELNVGLDNNGGFIGPAFAQIIVDHYNEEKLATACERAMRLLTAKMGMVAIPPELRFRLPVMSLCLVAANIAAKHNLLPFNVAAMTDALAAALLRYSEQEREEEAHSESNALNIPQTLISYVMQRPGLNVITCDGQIPIIPERATDATTAHLDVTNQLIHINAMTLKLMREKGVLGNRFRRSKLSDIGALAGKEITYGLVKYCKGTIYENEMPCLSIEMPKDIFVNCTKMFAARGTSL
jgi:hypothetical protein